MSKNKAPALSNELINIEELEQRTAPCGMAALTDQ